MPLLVRCCWPWQNAWLVVLPCTPRLPIPLLGVVSQAGPGPVMMMGALVGPFAQVVVRS